MGRSHARVRVEIWDDPTFLALTSAAQRLYLLLLSQPDLSHVGVLALTPRRWASLSPDTTRENIETALSELDAARFVLVDEATEEVAIRTLLHHDGVTANPKMQRPVADALRRVRSHPIRDLVRQALDSDEAGRAIIEIAGIGPAYRESDYQSDYQSDSQSHVDPLARARVRTAPAPAPAPAPTPAPKTSAAEKASSALATNGQPDKPKAPGKPDLLWDAMVEVLGLDQNAITDSMRGRINAALKQLRKVAATPEQIVKHAAVYVEKYGRDRLTASALAAHWAALGGPVVKAHRYASSDGWVPDVPQPATF